MIVCESRQDLITEVFFSIRAGVSDSLKVRRCVELRTRTRLDQEFVGMLSW